MHVRHAAPRDSRRVRRRDGLAQRASAGLLLDGRLVDRLLRLREGDRRRQSEPDPLVIHRWRRGARDCSRTALGCLRRGLLLLRPQQRTLLWAFDVVPERLTRSATCETSVSMRNRSAPSLYSLRSGPHSLNANLASTCVCRNRRSAERLACSALLPAIASRRRTRGGESRPRPMRKLQSLSHVGTR